GGTGTPSSTEVTHGARHRHFHLRRAGSPSIPASALALAGEGVACSHRPAVPEGMVPRRRRVRPHSGCRTRLPGDAGAGAPIRVARRSDHYRDGHLGASRAHPRIPVGRRDPALGTRPRRQRRLLADAHPHRGRRGIRLRARRRLARGARGGRSAAGRPRGRLVPVGSGRRTRRVVPQDVLTTAFTDWEECPSRAPRPHRQRPS
ncbi:LOW QUALITY PROTEIN: hypothetical protein OPAG_06011, partial [Rhodococcus opacus PD630]